MVKTKGFRVKTRHLLRRHPRDRGKTGLFRILYNHRIGEKVIIRIDPSFHKGMPHRRYHGKIGVLRERRGRAYLLDVKQGKKNKEIIIRPEHLKPYEKK